jgi:hypothetical protein
LAPLAKVNGSGSAVLLNEVSDGMAGPRNN